jgi:hypothetical protein
VELLDTKKAENASLFIERLPKKPYCSEGKGHALQIRAASHALKRPLIQYNRPALIAWLCFDVDTNAIEALHASNLPTPSLVVLNKDNGRGHIYYGLTTPVCRTSAARLKPLKLAAVVEEGLRVALGADEGFAGLIGKTPHHEQWRTLEPKFEALYDLGDLAEWVDLPKKVPKRLGIRTGIGRNVELFDRLRFWSYRWLNDYKAKNNLEGWGRAVLGQCQKFNNFAQPLPDSEVRAVAKSVAKWTWQKYTGRMDDKDFSKLQSARSAKQKRKVKTEQIHEVLNASTTSS